MTRILITGVAGFIGSHLAERLLLEGHEVSGVDRFSDYYSPDLKRANVAAAIEQGLQLIEDDVVEMDLDTALADVSHIIHLAGQPGVRPSWGQSFDLYLRDNVAATQRLLESARRMGDLKRFVYASSSSVYGDAETYPTSEKSPTAPRSPYGVTKLAGENLVSLYAKNLGLPAMSLRFFTVYGPRQRPDMAFTKLLTALDEGGTFDIFGDGSQVREFTYVADIVEAICRAISAEALPSGAVINLSGGSSVELRDAIAVAERVTGRRLNARYLPSALGDVQRTGGSTETARRLLDWEPMVGLADGLVAQWSWLSGLPRAGVI